MARVFLVVFYFSSILYLVSRGRQPQSKPKRLGIDQVDRFQRDGFLAPIPALSEEETERLCVAYEEMERYFGRRPKSTELSLTHLTFRWAYELVTHQAVLDAVEDILGSDILVWSSTIFTKYPRDPGYISFHQDGTYWGLDSTQVVTAWIALTESTVENGCMRVVPGSHQSKIQPHKETFAPDNLLSRGQEIQVEVNEADVRDVVLRPGEMSLHDVNIIHGSNLNRTNSKRLGFAIRYITPEVGQIGKPPPVILARGRDGYHHFDQVIESPPPLKSMNQQLAEHAVKCRKYVEAMRKTKAATG